MLRWRCHAFPARVHNPPTVSVAKNPPVNVVSLSCPNRNQSYQHRKQINRQLSSLMAGSEPICWWQAASCNQTKISGIGRKLQVLRATPHTRLTGSPGRRSPAGSCRKCLQTKWNTNLFRIKSCIKVLSSEFKMTLQRILCKMDLCHSIIIYSHLCFEKCCIYFIRMAALSCSGGLSTKLLTCQFPLINSMAAVAFREGRLRQSPL